ncbi:MAG: septum formation initiator family protein [Dethiobacter sp.]|jgi:cell division protein FtsB|nr:MAG: septum formation initiator family protein [Dethiobacter sp.]
MTAKIVNYPERSRKDLTRKFVIGFFIICIILSFYLFRGQTRSYLQVKKEIKELSSVVEAVRSENEHLKEEIILLRDKEYLEIQARKHLGMVRPGEIIFFVED